jgi:hypothetical protein
MEDHRLLKHFHLTLKRKEYIVFKGLCCKPEGREFETRGGEYIFSVYVILPAALGHGVYSASSRNEYQKQKKMYVESRALPVLRADNLIGICEPTV